MTDPQIIMDTDLDAYVDNQLDADGRLRVETFLAQHPAAAARVMADLGMRTTLRLAMSGHAASPRPQTREAARRLSSALAGRQMWRSLQRVAAVGVLVSVGWFANSSIGPFAPREVNASMHPPSFVEQAVRAHKTSQLRQAMPSQPQVRHLDRAEIRAATAIVMPDLPDDWQVADVQVFPSDFGPSVEMSIITGKGMPISLFAVRPGSFAVSPVQDRNLADGEAAWWQVGDVAYAIVSGTPQTGLVDEAETLRKTLY